MILKSKYYSRLPNEITDRLDYVFNNPEYDETKEKITSSSFREINSFIEEDSLQYGLTESGQETGKFAFVNIENLEIDGSINTESIRYLNEVPSEHILQKDDVLFSRSRRVGVCAVVSENEVGSTFGSYIIRFRVSPKKIRPLYLVKFVNSKLGQIQVEYLQTGSSGSNINSDQIKKIKVLDIDPEKQGEIVEKVISIEQRAKVLEEEVETVRLDSVHSMIEALDIECPIHLINPDSYLFRTGRDGRSPFFTIDFNEIKNRLSYNFHDPKQKIMNNLTSKYKITTLKNICREEIRRGQKPEYTTDGEALVIKTVDLKDAFIEYQNCLRVSMEFWESIKKAQVIKNDVLISSTGYGSMGKVDVFNKNYKAIVDSHITILRLKEGYNPYFVAYFLRSPFGKLQFEKMWSGSSGQIDVWPADLESFIIPENDVDGIILEKQNSIAEKITGILTRANQLDEQITHLRSDAKRTFNDFIFSNIK